MEGSEDSEGAGLTVPGGATGRKAAVTPVAQLPSVMSCHLGEKSGERGSMQENLLHSVPWLQEHRTPSSCCHVGVVKKGGMVTFLARRCYFQNRC